VSHTIKISCVDLCFKSINTQSSNAYFDVQMCADSRFIKTLETHICGESGPLDNFNPFLVTRQRWAPELLYLLNVHPLSSGQISSRLKIGKTETSKLLEDLTRIEAVKERSGIYSVAFPIFSRDDLFILKHATKPIAREVSARITYHKEEIEPLAKGFSSFEQVGKGKLLFAALGCFVLDWSCLTFLQEDGVLIKNKRQPGNRDYLLFAREQVKPNESTRLYDKMYWGSSSDEVEGFVFTSFGDHNGIRWAFPDIMWTLHASSRSAAPTFHQAPSWMGEKMSVLVDMMSRRLLNDVGHSLFRLNEEGPISVKDLQKTSETTGTLDVSRLLEDMKYITKEKGFFKLNYPLFAAKDKNIIERLGHLVSPLVAKAIDQNRAKLRKALRNTSPIRNRIEFTEVLTEAWHWIFAQSNKILAEEEFMYDPPAGRVGEARYIAWVSQFRSDFP
jgi:hypothetical protein